MTRSQVLFGGRRTMLAGVAGSLAAPALVRADTYPNRPVRYINPYPAGGPTDTLSRIFCAKMTELTGQQWIVENRGGAGGNVGMDALAKSDADGYVLGLGGIAAHAIAPHPLRQAALQPAHRLHLRDDDLVAAQSARGQSRRAGQVGAGADRALPQQSRQVFLRLRPVRARRFT